MRTYLILFFFVISSFVVLGQDSILVHHLKSNLATLSFDQEKLSGDGHDFLKNEAKATPFFVIGEEHGVAEIALFTAALFKSIKSYGYKYYATEVGPNAARQIQRLASEKGWEDRFSTYFEKYPFSIPFFSWKEECQVLQSVIAGEPDNEDLIWGLDQEFAASLRSNFKLLEEQATTPQSQALANEYYVAAQKAFNEVMESKNPSKMMLSRLTPKDFEKMTAAFGNQPNSQELINELAESIEIYQLWFTREGHKSNFLRAEMMKRYFKNYLDKSDMVNSESKVLIKLGASHQYRGLNGLNIPDIGNFISETASAHGKHSFHLYVASRKGSRNAFSPFSESESDKAVPFDRSKEADDSDFIPLLEAMPKDEWGIIDLRPLRHELHNKTLKNVPEALEKLIWGYDAIMMIPEVRASSNF